jgi:integrative and conjugative element protein (TIGR02256 family)
LGGEVAELLCKAGVDHFRLCDSDRLTTGNVSRHVGGISDFGAPKTRAVSHRLLEINPYLELGQEDILNGSAVADLTTLSRFIGPADLTICTTADENVEAIINQVAVLIGKTILYGRAIRRAEMGRVFLVRPGIDACKNCLVLCSEDSRKGDTPPQGWIDIPETDTGELLHECGRPVIAGSAIDLSFVAGLIARVALDYLEDRIADKNHWVWVGKPAPGIDSRLACGRSTIATHLAPRIACPACQEPDVRELIITQGVKDQVTSLVESSPDKEMCGILVGYVDDMKRAIAVRAIGPGPRATRSRTTCQRDVEYIQHELNQSTDKLGEKGVYIGEWHSHLEPKPEPSPTDIQSLFGISGAINYLTRCPVMLIAGLDASTGKVTTYRSWAFQASGRMFCIANKTLPNDFIE